MYNCIATTMLLIYSAGALGNSDSTSVQPKRQTSIIINVSKIIKTVNLGQKHKIAVTSGLCPSVCTDELSCSWCFLSLDTALYQL